MDIESQRELASKSRKAHFRCSWMNSGCLGLFLQSEEPVLHSVLTRNYCYRCEPPAAPIRFSDVTLLKARGEEFLELLINTAPDAEWMEFLFGSLLIAARVDHTGVFHRLFALCKDSPDFWAADSRTGRFLNHTVDSGSVEMLSALLEVDFFRSWVKDLAEVTQNQRRLLPSALIIAARNGHRGCVELLIEAGSPLEYKWALGDTALSTAVESGHEGVVLQLLAAGADVDDAQGSEAYPRYPPLCVAVAQDNERLVSVLLEAGAGLGENRTHHLPVFVAASEGRCGPLKRLLLAGADVNAVNSTGQSALHLACEFSHEGAVELLLSRNASPTSRCEEGLSPADVVSTWVLRKREHRYGGRFPCTLTAAETAAADRIYNLLHGASAWGRRGWLVMMRARRLDASAQLLGTTSLDRPSPPAEQDPPGNACWAETTDEVVEDGVRVAVEAPTLRDASATGTSGGVDDQEEHGTPSPTKRAPVSGGGHGDEQVGHGDGWEDAVEWLLHCPDDRGVFREILSFL